MPADCPNEPAKNLFCAIRPDSGKCNCGNDYTVCATAVEAEWSTSSFPQTPAHDGGYGVGKIMAWKSKAKGIKQFNKPEAHHIVSVDAVAKSIVANTPLQDVVKATTYCVNEAENMIALPRFSFVISWYVNLETGEIPVKEVQSTTMQQQISENFGVQQNRLESSRGVSPFEGLAQHCTDHGPYLKLCTKKVEEVAQDAATDIPAHLGDDATSSLAGAIRGLIPDFKARLVDKNTHVGWNDGLNGKTDWYLQFSMVKKSEGATELPFPIWSSGKQPRVGNLIKELMKMFTAGVG